MTTNTKPKEYYSCLNCKKIVDASSPSSEYCRYPSTPTPGETGVGYCNDCAQKHVYECKEYECYCECRSFICGSCKKKSKTLIGSEYCNKTKNGYCISCAKSKNFFCENYNCNCGYVKHEDLDCCYAKKFNCAKCNNKECTKTASDTTRKLCDRCYNKSGK